MFVQKYVIKPLRVVFLVLVEVFFLFLMAEILPGFSIESWDSGIFFIVIVLVLNFSFRPLLLRTAVRFNIIVFVLSILVINALIFTIAAIPLKYVNLTLTSGIFLSLVFSIFDVIVSAFFRVPRKEKDYLKIVKKNSDFFEDNDKKGYLFLEIDGLGHRILKEGIKKGYAPNIQSLIKDTHNLTYWECDLSSQTSASQAGILLGNNEGIVAFRWYDRDLKRIVASSNSKEVKRLETELSTKDGLLVDNGVSVFNLFSGDATVSSFTLSQFEKSMKENWDNKSLYYYLVDPYNLPRSIVNFVAEIYNEYVNRLYQKFGSVIPRLHRNFKYAMIRGGMNVFARDVNYNAVIGKIYSGAGSIYSTFSGYDEVAHHSGIETSDAMVTLKKIDNKFGEVLSALKSSTKDYEVFILSDHGQSQGRTFKQLRGKTLDQVVKELLKDKIDVVGFTDYLEDKSNLKQFLGNLDKDKKLEIVDKLMENQIDSDLKEEIGQSIENKLVVLASGNLGLIYATTVDKRLKLEEFDKLFPGFIDNLSKEEGIGFLMVDSNEGPVVISNKGRVVLNSMKVTGENPLEEFGENAARHLLRTNSFKNCPDILVNSTYDKSSREGHAFEELIGFHGGLGGDQSHPFVVYPKKYEAFFEEEVIGAENLHKVFKKIMKSEK